MTIYLFDHACLATGDRFCCFCWRISACCLYSETSLRISFVVSRGDAGQSEGYKWAEGNAGQYLSKTAVEEETEWNGLNLLACAKVMKLWWT
jgi:hypothetical protein